MIILITRMTYIESISLIAAIIAIISIVTWNKHEKLRAFLFLILLICAFILGRYFFEDSKSKESSLVNVINNNGDFEYTVTLAEDISSIEYINKYKAITADFDNFYERDQAIEKHLLEKYSSLAKRDKIFLELEIDYQNNRVFRDGDVSDYTTEGGSFSLVDYFEKERFYLVSQAFYEGGSEYLINRENGQKKQICGTPYFSPTGRYVITTNYDLSGGYGCNELCIMEKVGNILEEKLVVQDSYGNVKWEDETTFVVEKVDLYYDDENDNSDYVHKVVAHRFEIVE